MSAQSGIGGPSSCESGAEGRSPAAGHSKRVAVSGSLTIVVTVAPVLSTKSISVFGVLMLSPKGAFACKP
jgi:hypothetical protein